MEQGRNETERYGYREVHHRGYLIEAWAEQDQGLPVFYGVARFRKADGDHPSQTIGAGADPFKDGPDKAVEWAIKEAQARIDSESGQVPMPQ